MDSVINGTYVQRHNLLIVLALKGADSFWEETSCIFVEIHKNNCFSLRLATKSLRGVGMLVCYPSLSRQCAIPGQLTQFRLGFGQKENQAKYFWNLQKHTDTFAFVCGKAWHNAANHSIFYLSDCNGGSNFVPSNQAQMIQMPARLRPHGMVMRKHSGTCFLSNAV